MNTCPSQYLGTGIYLRFNPLSVCAPFGTSAIKTSGHEELMQPPTPAMTSHTLEHVIHEIRVLEMNTLRHVNTHIGTTRSAHSDRAAQKVRHKVGGHSQKPAAVCAHRTHATHAHVRKRAHVDNFPVRTVRAVMRYAVPRRRRRCRNG